MYLVQLAACHIYMCISVFTHTSVYTHISRCIHTHVDTTTYRSALANGGASNSRLLKIIGLFCKRALSKRRYSAKETYHFKEPTNRSHPIAIHVLGPAACMTYIYVYIYIHPRIYTYTHIYTSIYTHIYTYRHIHKNIYTHRSAKDIYTHRSARA